MTERNELTWTKDVEFVANRARYRITVCSNLQGYTASVGRIDFVGAPVVPIFLNDPPRAELPAAGFYQERRAHRDHMLERIKSDVLARKFSTHQPKEPEHAFSRANAWQSRGVEALQDEMADLLNG